MKNVTEPTEHFPTLSETFSAKSKLNVVLDSAESTFVQIHYQIPTKKFTSAA